MKTAYGIIYFIRNKVNGKMYIGQTINFTKRIKDHKYNYIHFPNKSPHLYAAINKHNWNNFEIEILDIAFLKTNLDILECHYIDLFNTLDKDCGYNLEKGGHSGPNSFKTRQKISVNAKNRFIDKNNHPMFNRNHTKESNDKNRNSNKTKKSIICNETEQLFGSAKAAAKILNIRQGNISRHLRDPVKFKKAQGYTFRFS